MTNNDIQILPWDTSHLICACGHKWDDHHPGKGFGCYKCDCDA